MPAESISIVGGCCIGGRPARIPKLRAEIRFVRVPAATTAPPRSRIARIIYTVIHNVGGGGILEWDYARAGES